MMNILGSDCNIIIVVDPQNYNDFPFPLLWKFVVRIEILQLKNLPSQTNQTNQTNQNRNSQVISKSVIGRRRINIKQFYILLSDIKRLQNLPKRPLDQ